LKGIESLAKLTKPVTTPNSVFERRTERLKLRRLAPDDVEALVALHTDPRTNVHRPDGPMLAEESEAMARSLVDAWEDGLAYWAVELDGAFVGIAGCEPRMTNGVAWWNLYYRFSPDVWGRGLATEAAREAVKVALAQRPARPVIARVRPSNVASIRVAEKAGLIRQSGMDADGFVVYSSG
jgi:[ribosomal protein S5]-alanine N-acetyltransferase